MSTNASPHTLLLRWQQLGPRERLGVRMAVAVVLLGLIWQLVAGPALATLRSADAQARTLDAQLQEMQALQQQARALQAQPVLRYEEAVRALTQASQQTLGTSGELVVAADQAKLTLKAASADALARWLAQARLNARALPIEAHLTRAAADGSWSGVLTLALPPQTPP